MKGLVIINGYPSAEKFLRQGERIVTALRTLGIQADVKKNGEVFAMVTASGKVESHLKEEYDFAVYLDKDKYLGKMLEKEGLRLFNSAMSIEVCDDKMSTYLALLDKNIPLLESIPAPLCYTNGAKVNVSFLEQVAQELGFPLVVKKSFGSFGVGVQLVHGMPELQKIEEEWLHEPHFYQRYEECSKGKDVRVIVIGGKAVAAMERRALGEEFRSNIELGGKGIGIRLDKEYCELAEKCAKELGLDYCGVDLLFGKTGAVVCEVNSNAFFEAIERVTGKDIAMEYALHIRKSMKIG